LPPASRTGSSGPPAQPRKLRLTPEQIAYLLGFGAGAASPGSQQGTTECPRPNAAFAEARHGEMAAKLLPLVILGGDHPRITNGSNFEPRANPARVGCGAAHVGASRASVARHPHRRRDGGADRRRGCGASARGDHPGAELESAPDISDRGRRLFNPLSGIPSQALRRRGHGAERDVAPAHHHGPGARRRQGVRAVTTARCSGWCEATGPLKTGCTSSATSCSARARVACGRATPRTSSRPSATPRGSGAPSYRLALRRTRLSVPRGRVRLRAGRQGRGIEGRGLLRRSRTQSLL